MVNKSFTLLFFFQIFIFNVFSQSSKTVIPLNFLKQTVSQANPGDTIFIKNGLYKDFRITLNYSKNDFIFIMAEEPGKVIFTEKSTLIFQKSRNISFSGVYFNRITNPSSLILYNSSRIEITNNYFFRCGINPFHTIIRIQNGSFENKICNNTFEKSMAMSVVIRLDNELDSQNIHNHVCKNIFYDIPSVSSIYKGQVNGMEAIQIGQGLNSEVKLFTKIYNNLFQNIFGDGAEIISNKSSNNEIYKNIFLDNNSGITLRTGDNVTFRDNYLDNTSQGVRIFGSGHKIINNLIVNCKKGIQIPSTDIPFDAEDKTGGYNQQRKVKIFRNCIINNYGSSILIGDSRRALNPVKLKVKNNKIYNSISSNELVLSDDLYFDDIKFRRNEVLEPREQINTNPLINTKSSQTKIIKNRIQFDNLSSSKVRTKIVNEKTPICPSWRCPFN
ncbi:MAG: chondroitinase-B domain-containing protein [Cyclobacterium sp.]|uniref:chondroitinase-B domain-containing protein n=1 Tax=Cyclobacterium sp. TaxID=1966343 RepID=UPI0039707351